jgi:HAD superfamily hydrolase (TIGR01484 family)
VRLVATDLDGTLLEPDGRTVSERNQAALRRVGEHGVTVVLVTGRPPRFARGVVDPGLVHALLICANGAVVYDPEADRVVEQNQMPGAVMARIVAALRAEAPGAVFAVETGSHFHRETGYATLMNRLDESVPIPDILAFAGEGADVEPVGKLIVRHPGLALAELYELALKVAGEDAVATHSGYEMVEISAAGVTKAFALERLAAELGVPAAEVTAFGDMPNDLPMLRWAGHGVAVANAHADVLAGADEVTAANTEHGVARVLERFVPCD